MTATVNKVKLKNCPYCGSDYIRVFVDRMGVSYIACTNYDCNARVQIDCTKCSDPPTDNLLENLIRMWNRRDWEEE